MSLSLIHIWDERLAQIARGDVGRGAAADDLFALLGEEEVHHLDVVLRIRRRADDQIDALARAHAHHSHGGIVARLALVEAVALIDDVGGDVLGRVVRVVVGLGKVDDVVPLPAVVELLAHAGKGRAVGPVSYTHLARQERSTLRPRRNIR